MDSLPFPEVAPYCTPFRLSAMLSEAVKDQLAKNDVAAKLGDLSLKTASTGVIAYAGGQVSNFDLVTLDEINKDRAKLLEIQNTPLFQQVQKTQLRALTTAYWRKLDNEASAETTNWKAGTSHTIFDTAKVDREDGFGKELVNLFAPVISKPSTYDKGTFVVSVPGGAGAYDNDANKNARAKPFVVMDRVDARHKEVLKKIDDLPDDAPAYYKNRLTVLASSIQASWERWGKFVDTEWTKAFKPIKKVNDLAIGSDFRVRTELLESISAKQQQQTDAYTTRGLEGPEMTRQAERNKAAKNAVEAARAGYSHWLASIAASVAKMDNDGISGVELRTRFYTEVRTKREREQKLMAELGFEYYEIDLLDKKGEVVVQLDGSPVKVKKYKYMKHDVRRDGFGEGDPVPDAGNPGFFIFKEYKPWTMERGREILQKLKDAKVLHIKMRNREFKTINGEKVPVIDPDTGDSMVDASGNILYEKYEWPETWRRGPKYEGQKTLKNVRVPKKLKVKNPATGKKELESDDVYLKRTTEVVFLFDENGDYLLDDEGKRVPEMRKILQGPDKGKETPALKRKEYVNQSITAEDFQVQILGMTQNIANLEKRIQMRELVMQEARASFNFPPIILAGKYNPDGDWPAFVKWEKPLIERIQRQAYAVQRMVFNQQVFQSQQQQRMLDYQRKRKMVEELALNRQERKQARAEAEADAEAADDLERQLSDSGSGFNFNNAEGDEDGDRMQLSASFSVPVAVAVM